MVKQVIRLTGSSNHNKCAKADVNDSKTWCYTTDSNKRWEHCNQVCTDHIPTSTPPTDSIAGTRFRDIPENVPHVDPRSKYDQKGNCFHNCKSRIFGAGIEQCGRNQCQKPKPRLPRIHSWFQPSAEFHDDCFDCNARKSSNQYSSTNKAFVPFSINIL